MTAAIVRISPLSVVGGPWDAVPGSIKANGWRVDGAKVGDEVGNYRVVNVVYSGDQPTQYHTLNTETPDLSGNTLTITRTWTAPTLAAAKIILKDLIETEATKRWIAARGVTSAAIESAVTDGKAAVNAAGNLAAALAAYQAVVWP